MGKLATIYLSDEEARTLTRFCEENRCTQYSAIKIAIRELTAERAKSNTEKTTKTEQTDENLPIKQQPEEQAQAARSHKPENSIPRTLLKPNTQKD